MSDDQFLRERLRRAAEDAGSHADPAKAHGLVARGPVATPVAAPKLWMLGALATVGLVAGTLLGVTVLRPEASAAGSPAVVLDRRVGAFYDCPDGAEVGTLRAGDRVYSIGRNQAGDWSAIRDPRRSGATVWVPTDALVLDDQVDLDVVDCDRREALAAPGAPAETTIPDPADDPEEPDDPEPDGPSTTTDPDVPTPPSTGGPGSIEPPRPGSQPPTTRPTPTTRPPSPTTTPAPPPDTVAPTVSPVGGANPPEIFRSSWAPYCAVSTQLTVRATDAVGVTSVSGAYASGLPGSPIAFSRIGGSARDGTWRATFGPFDTTLPGSGSRSVPVTVTARDGAGNSRTTTITVTYHSTCLI